MPWPVFERVLIANRGEIAVRVIRACRDLELSPVVVFSDADREALHVALADAAYAIGPAPAAESYLRVERIIAAAQELGAQAVHPGYGFLSENVALAEACARAGITFIGPSVSAITAMGDKTRARQTMVAAGVPVVPGSPQTPEDPDAAVEQAQALGFPVLLKAAAGGGGKGMRRCEDAAEVRAAFESAQREAEAAFGDPTVFVEKAIINPRHVEIQILADGFGTVLHLGERDCSVQRRHQKVIEETPCPVLTPAQRQAMGDAAVAAARTVDYVGAGTVEFLLDGSGAFYFLEMNTRIQVEHPITEMVTGVDLVAWQIKIAAGEPLELEQQSLGSSGHAIECRLYAEDPALGWMPSPGQIHRLRLPSGPGIRVDAGVSEGGEVPVHYDPMIAKLIAWGPDRAVALRRMARALEEMRIEGPATNLEWHRRALRESAFVTGRYDTSFVETLGPGPEADELERDLLCVAAALEAEGVQPPPPSLGSPSPSRSGWRWSDGQCWRSGRLR